jgi:hypothetical protein
MLFFKIHLDLNQIVMNDSKFKRYITYNLFMTCLIWTSIFLNKTSIFATSCNIVVLFSTTVEKCS